MTNYNPRNERIKRAYFVLLKQAAEMADATADGVRKALLRFEEFTGFTDVSALDQDQAIGFKKHLAKQAAVRTGKPLSHATVFSTVRAVQAFFRWLAREPGYKSRIHPSDIRYMNLSRKDVAIATAARTKRVPTVEQIRATLATKPTGSDIEQIVLEWVSYLRKKKLYGNDDPLFPRSRSRSRLRILICKFLHNLEKIISLSGLPEAAIMEGRRDLF